jgi:hypothetical protein
MLQQGAQPVPRLQMDAIVCLVPVIGLEVHWYCPVICHAQAVNQLLEIGTAFFAVPALELKGLRILMIVATPDHHTGRVVVNAFHRQIEALHDGQHDARLQGGAVGREQPIECTPKPVVADLAVRDEPHIIECDPFPNRIEGVAIDHDVLQQREQHIGVTGVLQRQAQLVLESHALDEVVQNRQCAHTQPAQAQSFLLHDLT